MVKTQSITLDKLTKFLDTIKRHRIINIIPDEYGVIEDTADRYVIGHKLVSVLIFYQEI